MGSNTSVDAKLTALDYLTWCDIATYSCVLLFGVRNTAKYLVM